MIVDECKWKWRKLKKFVPDGLGFLTEVGADEICWEGGGLGKTVESW